MSHKASLLAKTRLETAVMSGIFSPRDLYLWIAVRLLLWLAVVAALVGAVLWLLHRMGKL